MTESIVSVIIPTRNRKHMLNNAVESIFKQTINDWELIIVDDASTDQTCDVVATWIKKDKRVHYKRNNVPVGGGGARNIGLNMAEGEFVAFLDDDDTWEPTKLEKQRRLLNENQAAVAASCWFTAWYFFGKRIFRTADNPSLQQLLSDNILGTASTCMARTEAVASFDGFSESLPSAQDWDMWVKLRKIGDIPCIRHSLVNYSVHQQPKISTDLRKKYIGTRHFYIKYRHLMTRDTRCDVLAAIAYLRSRNSGNLRMKLLWLIRSLKWDRGLSRKVMFILSVLYHLKDRVFA